MEKEKMENGVPERVSVRIDSRMAARLEALLPANQGSLSILIRRLLIQGLDAEEGVPGRLERIEKKLDKIMQH